MEIDFLEFLDGKLRETPDRYFRKRELIEAYLEHAFRVPQKILKESDLATAQNQFDYAYKRIKKTLKEIHHTSLDFKNGKDGAEGFRYPLDLQNPMAEQLKETHKMRLGQLQRLLASSEGLFPSSWLADLVSGTRMLAQEEGKGVIVDFDHSSVSNLSLVPTFFDAIEKELVLSFSYRPKYGEQLVQIQFHPYYLKEFNLRWFVYGRSTDEAGRPLQMNICGIDRIEGSVVALEGVSFIPPKKRISSEGFFKDIVGVTRTNASKVDIEIETNDAESFSRILSKPLHRSQHKLMDHIEGKQRGKFRISVKPNPELMTLLMSFGPGIEILSPEDYRQEFASKVNKMYELYL